MYFQTTCPMRLSHVFTATHMKDGGLVQIQQIWPPKHNGRTQVQLGDKNSALKNTMLWPRTRCDTYCRACGCMCVCPYKNAFKLTLTDSHTFLPLFYDHQVKLLPYTAAFISLLTSFRSVILKWVAAVSPLFTQWILDAFVNGFKLSHHCRKKNNCSVLRGNEKLPETNVHTWKRREKILRKTGCITKKAASKLLVSRHLIAPHKTKEVTLNRWVMKKQKLSLHREKWRLCHCGSRSVNNKEKWWNLHIREQICVDLCLHAE